MRAAAVLEGKQVRAGVEQRDRPGLVDVEELIGDPAGDSGGEGLLVHKLAQPLVGELDQAIDRRPPTARGHRERQGHLGIDHVFPAYREEVPGAAHPGTGQRNPLRRVFGEYWDSQLAALLGGSKGWIEVDDHDPLGAVVEAGGETSAQPVPVRR